MEPSSASLFEVKPIDREFYTQRLQSFLPTCIIDIHTHVWLNQFKRQNNFGLSPGPTAWPWTIPWRI